MSSSPLRAVPVDENFPRLAAAGLAAAGHDVAAVAAIAPGLDDDGVLELARAGGRWLLSFDTDFGDLVFHRAAASPPAVVLFRLHPIAVEEVLRFALQALEEVPVGSFAVVTRDGTRIRPLPQPRPAATP